MHYSIDITTVHSFKYIELIDSQIWISKYVPLCRVFANQVTASVEGERNYIVLGAISVNIVIMINLLGQFS